LVTGASQPAALQVITEAASVFHLLRTIGSSFFISLSVAEIVHATGSNYSRMTVMIAPYNSALAMQRGEDPGCRP
jgi:hypothetical protein